MTRDCPTCSEPMEDLGVALDDDGQMFNQYRCRECGDEAESKVRPQFGWRTEITERVRAYRGGAA